MMYISVLPLAISIRRYDMCPIKSRTADAD